MLEDVAIKEPLWQGLRKAGTGSCEEEEEDPIRMELPEHYTQEGNDINISR